jgi:hypothetical protein
MPHRKLTDADLLAVDVPAMLSAGLGADAGPPGTVAVAAALAAARLGTQPRSVTFLAEIIRRGGIEYAVQLAEPLPTPGQSALAHRWLAAAKPAAGDAARDEAVARWLDTVAVILAARRTA